MTGMAFRLNRARLDRAQLKRATEPLRRSH
jgi:hypothetical protein